MLALLKEGTFWANGSEIHGEDLVSPHQLDTEEHHVERKHGDAEASGHAELAHDDRDDNGEQHKK